MPATPGTSQSSCPIHSSTGPPAAVLIQKGPPAAVLIQKQDPGFPYIWRSRYFAIDHKRGSLVYSEDAAGTKIKGAIPLELCHAVSPSNDKLGFSVEIADRTFTCRFPKLEGDSLTPSDGSSPRDAFVIELFDAIAAHPPSVPSSSLPPCHWKDHERYRGRRQVSYEERAGTLSRQPKAGYPKRARPLVLDWGLSLATYQPPHFTSAKLAPPHAPATEAAAEAAAPREVDWGARRSWEGPIELFDGAPRNPIGRTGLAGRGHLPRWGANQEARIAPLAAPWAPPRLPSSGGSPTRLGVVPQLVWTR